MVSNLNSTANNYSNNTNLYSLNIDQSHPSLLGLPIEVWFNVFNQMDVLNQAKAKQVCRTWKQIASDPRLLLSHMKIAQENVDKLRPLLTSGTNVMEDLWITPQLNDQGEIVALDSPFISVDPNKKGAKGLHSFQLHIRAENWDPEKGPAFYEEKEMTPLPDHLKGSVKLLLNKLNDMAKAAWAKTQEPTYQKKKEFAYQEWLAVMMDPKQYPTSQLLASSDKQG